ncbi:hypothetical protein PUN28_020629 [Cardiocondyla obscurior]|uniref:Uncharacterized protein n=1 Tax=Cardiocondyla obscurior TaxID=286306 RepID=A0AAW2E5H0_9HYME
MGRPTAHTAHRHPTLPRTQTRHLVPRWGAPQHPILQVLGAPKTSSTGLTRPPKPTSLLTTRALPSLPSTGRSRPSSTPTSPRLGRSRAFLRPGAPAFLRPGAPGHPRHRHLRDSGAPEPSFDRALPAPSFDRALPAILDTDLSETRALPTLSRIFAPIRPRPRASDTARAARPVIRGNRNNRRGLLPRIRPEATRTNDLWESSSRQIAVFLDNLFLKFELLLQEKTRPDYIKRYKHCRSVPCTAASCLPHVCAVTRLLVGSDNSRKCNLIDKILCRVSGSAAIGGITAIRESADNFSGRTAGTRDAGAKRRVW